MQRRELPCPVVSNTSCTSESPVELSGQSKKQKAPKGEEARQTSSGCEPSLRPSIHLKLPRAGGPRCRSLMAQTRRCPPARAVADVGDPAQGQGPPLSSRRPMSIDGSWGADGTEEQGGGSTSTGRTWASPGLLPGSRLDGAPPGELPCLHPGLWQLSAWAPSLCCPRRQEGPRNALRPLRGRPADVTGCVAGCRAGWLRAPGTSPPLPVPTGPCSLPPGLLPPPLSCNRRNKSHWGLPPSFQGNVDMGRGREIWGASATPSHPLLHPMLQPALWGGTATYCPSLGTRGPQSPRAQRALAASRQVFPDSQATPVPAPWPELPSPDPWPRPLSGPGSP